MWKFDERERDSVTAKMIVSVSFFVADTGVNNKIV